MMEPHYAIVNVQIGNTITCCGWCGAHVPAAMQPTHNAWHAQLAQVADQASYADAATRPIG